MITLLQHYSGTEILIFAVLLGLAIKSLVTFFDWAYARLKQVFNKETDQLSKEEELEQRLSHGSAIMHSLQQQQQETDQILKQLTEKINLLISSDRDDIRSAITRSHHYYCYDKGWIDDFSLDCLERRFRHYEDEGGNSFIQGFMNDLRKLPKQKPDK